VNSRFRAAAAAVALLVALGGCGGDDDDDEAAGKRAIDVGYAFGFDVGDTGDRVAFDRLKRETGIRARFREMGGAANTVTGLLRGDIDIGNVTFPDAINAIERGADIKLVLGANMFVDFLLAARPGIDDLAELKGQRVVYGSRGPSEAVAKVAVERSGLDEDEIELSSLQESTRRAAALVSGRADAVVLETVDFRRIAEDEPGIKALARIHEIAPFALNNPWIVRSNFAEANRKLLHDVVGGLLDGYEFVRSSEGRAAWIDKATAGPLEDESPSFVEATYDHYRRNGFWPRRNRPVPRQLHDRSTGFWMDAGQIERGVPFETAWDISFWEKAAER
jgi:ABC-type nitrate/sulfonate/bicarbonate transport system substrate-binding protein